MTASFSDYIGPVTVQPVQTTDVVKVPFIFWGGDVATFLANGGLKTQKGSIYSNLGLNLQLYSGDDFPTQVKKYMSGESPYIRGTTSMLGLASEVLGKDPRTKPVVILQMTWSVGDHCVARNTIKSVNDFKGKKIALQSNGPHVGFLDEILRLANMKWSDINVVWVKDLTGPKGVAEVFRQDSTIDACFVVTPDMIGLCGGLTSKGGDSEGNVKDSFVVVSTDQMSRSIADVYAVRKDYFDSNKDKVEKFVAGYLKAVEELISLKSDYESKGPKSKQYVNVLKMAQDIYGVELLPTLEVDTHGLICDAKFVRLPGNISFFNDKGNLNNFEVKSKNALNLAVDENYVKVRTGFFTGDWDYQHLASIAGIEYVVPQQQSNRINAESLNIFPDSELDDKTILSFTISFKENQSDFPPDVYGSEFDRVAKAASSFGNAVVVIRGHSDPTKTIVDFLKVGMAKGIIQRNGTKGNYSYFFNGQPLDIKNIDAVIKSINNGDFDQSVIVGGSPLNPRETVQAAINLSKLRADNVKSAIISYVKEKGVNLDVSQIQPQGVGIREPLIPNPKNASEALQNMRVEFRIIKVPAEAIKSTDFDY